MSRNGNYYRRVLKAERVENFFDQTEYFLSIFSPLPFKINEISKILDFNDVIIFGAPGTGKSSILRILCWDMLLKIKELDWEKYSNFKNLLGLEKQELPFFGFYININKEFEEGFFGRGISDNDWQSIYLYYFCLFIIDSFLKNLFNYNNSYFSKILSWNNNRIPTWVKKANNLSELHEIVKIKISGVHEFLNDYNEIYKDFKIQLVQNEFFSPILQEILNSINADFAALFIILDDFSFIKVNLMKPIINFLGKRSSQIYLKVGSRISPFLKKWPGMDERDIKTVDIDYELINSKERVYKQIVTDIALNRISTLGKKITSKDFEELFEDLSPYKEAEIYSELINYDDDAFFRFLTKNFATSKLSKEELLELYNYFESNGIHPLKKKIIEILFARKINKIGKRRILKKQITELFSSFNQFLTSDEKKIKRLTSIALHLLSRDAKKQKIYCGYDTIWKLSSFVFQNFLFIMEKIFDEYEIQKGVGKPMTTNSITLSMQNKVIYDLSFDYFNNKIVSNSEYGPDIKIFFEIIIKELIDQFKPQASYDNGKTGFAVNINEYEKLINDFVIKEAISYSYLQIKDVKKGLIEDTYTQKKHVVFYFNRLLLPCFNFLIQYGGYQKFTYNQIKTIIEDKKLVHPKQTTLIDFFT